MDWRRRSIFALGVIIGVIAMGVAMGIVFSPGDAGKVSDGVAFGAPSGMNATIYGETNVSMEDMFTGNGNVSLRTEAGNITLAADDTASASVHTSNMTGTWTNVTEISAGATWIRVYPDDKQRVDVRGDTDQLSIRSVTVDDGTTDLWVEGPDGGTATVKLYTLPANTWVAAVDANGNALDTVKTDGSGVASFDLGLSAQTVTFQSVNPQAPQLANPDPTGQVVTKPDEVSVDVSDANFNPGDEVQVTIEYDGSQIKQTNITSNQTVTATLPTVTLGSHTWNVTATDQFGETTTAEYSFETPSKLYVYEETAPHPLIDNATVNATITGSNESVKLDQVGDGTFSLEGLPADESYVFTITTDGYYTREVYVQSIFEQQAIFLLSENVTAVTNQLTVTDRTGRFSDNPAILVDRVINTSLVANTSDNGEQWVTVGGDRLGASGFYVIDLDQDARYRFRVLNGDGDVRVLGEYTAKENGTVNLDIGTVSYSLSNANNTYAWDTELTNVSGGNYTATFSYNDYTNSTDNLSVQFVTRDEGIVLGSADFTNGPYGEIVFTEPINQTEYDNYTLVVEWSATFNGEVITGQRLVAGKALLDFSALDAVWQAVLFAGITLVLMFLVGAGVGVAPALITGAFWSGFAVYIGFAPPELGFGATLLVLLLGVIYMIRAPSSPAV